MNERFELPAELTIYTAQQTREALLEWAKSQDVKAGAALKISARDVGAVDGAGLQLLAALGNAEASWQLVDTSAVFSDACRAMGLTAWLDSPYLASAETGGLAS